MRAIRIIENFVELLLLCVATFFLLKHIGKDVASHDGIVIVVLFFGYAALFCMNFLRQTVLLDTSKTGYRYFLAKIKWFALLLIITTLFIMSFFHFEVGSIYFLAVSAAVFVSYIGIVILLFFIEETWQHKENSILGKLINRIIIPTLKQCFAPPTSADETVKQ
jgi:hypothetical protein